jgi:hypothetical protein
MLKDSTHLDLITATKAKDLKPREKQVYNLSVDEEIEI